MTDPIQSYLVNLQQSLPFDATTSQLIVREARDHLLCAARALQKAGISSSEARVKAVHDFGSIDDFIHRFKTEGGPVTPRDWKSSPMLAGVLVVPALLFVLANLLRFNVFGNRFLYENVVTPVLGQPIPGIFINFLITLGPIAAMFLSGKQIVTFRRSTEPEGGSEAVVQLRWGHLLVVGVGLCLTAAIASYLFFENLPHL